jgi:hypothetical protein
VRFVAARASIAGYNLSSATFRLTLLPVVTVTVRCHGLKPPIATTTVWSPAERRRVDGVVPANFPSIVMSAPGDEVTIKTARSAVLIGFPGSAAA